MVHLADAFDLMNDADALHLWWYWCSLDERCWWTARLSPESRCSEATGWSSGWMVFLDLQDDVVVVEQVPVEEKDVHIEDEDIDEGLEAILDVLAILDADEVEWWHSWWWSSRQDVHLRALRRCTPRWCSDRWPLDEMCLHWMSSAAWCLMIPFCWCLEVDWWGRCSPTRWLTDVLQLDDESQIPLMIWWSWSAMTFFLDDYLLLSAWWHTLLSSALMTHFLPR